MCVVLHYKFPRKEVSESFHSLITRIINLVVYVYVGADPITGDYTLSLDLRVSRLPPVGHLQSLLRFPLSDLELTRRLHRTSIYLNPEGYVVARPLLCLLPVTKASTVNLAADATITEGATAKLVDPDMGQGKVKPGYWAVVTLVVSPSSGTVTSYVNSKFSHVSSNLDPADLKLNHKIVVLGGGKQAHARGGDVRRLVIHSKALG